MALLHTPFYLAGRKVVEPLRFDALMEDHCSQLCATLTVSTAKRTYAFTRRGSTPSSAQAAGRSVHSLHRTIEKVILRGPYPDVILSLSIPTETRLDDYGGWGLALHRLPKPLARVFIGLLCQADRPEHVIST